MLKLVGVQDVLAAAVEMDGGGDEMSHDAVKTKTETASELLAQRPQQKPSCFRVQVSRRALAPAWRSD